MPSPREDHKMVSVEEPETKDQSTKEVIQDESEDQTVTEVEESESVETPESDDDRGKEDKGIREVAEGKESELSDEEEEKESVDVSELKKEIIDEIKGEQKQPVQQKVTELSEEEWGQKENEWGIGRESIRKITNQQILIYNKLMDAVDEKFAKFEKRDAIDTLATDPRYSDIKQHQKDIDEFLSAFDARHHANSDLLKRGLFYARGKKSKANVQRARNESERNKKIVVPASPTGAKKSVPPKLSDSHKSAASVFGMSDNEYEKLRKDRGKPIAI